jgi:hypothetical protein
MFSPLYGNTFATMKRFAGWILGKRLAACALAGGLATGPACAGDILVPSEPAQAPNAPNNAHCSALGEGFFAVTGSDACIRISGYVAAGAEFGGGLRPGRAPAPFDANATSVMHTYTGVSVDAQFDTPMGPGLIHVDGGRGNFGP